MLKRAIIIGCPGAGKSTFARRLSEITQLPLYHLDMIWHRPDRTTADRDTFDEKLKEILSEEKWIIDGNYSRTLEVRMQECDTVYFLDLPIETCLAGVESRIGKPRSDMPWIETEFDEEFRQWILDFPERELPGMYRLLEKYKYSKKVYVFHSRREVDDYFQKIFHSV